ncbi:MAG: hypothetical protein AYK23_05795 [Candidatus Proteinoplasmatales archaeon SG8-5]|nr:MAG: hypothetical protein AYK23_05795 [Candidatus Proteinoplasmatales archaeon SG8-5]
MGKPDNLNMARFLIIGVFLSLVFIFLAGLGSAQYEDDYSFFGTMCLCNVIVGILVLITTIWVYVDGEKIAGPDGKVLHTSPLVWAICVFLIWIICFPWYLYSRHKHLENMHRARIMKDRHPCTFCGTPLVWLENKQAWYCRKCRK